MRLSQEAIRRMTEGRGGSGGGGGSSLDPALLAGYATQQWVNDNYLSIGFFSKLFKAYDSASTPNEVSPNDTESTITNIKAMFGFWTDQYLSALGKNNSGGGGGGVTALADLIDVQLTSPTNGQALIYNSSLTKWVNGEAGMNETQLANYLNTNGYLTQSAADLRYLELNGNAASASRLSGNSAYTAWGQTYWNSGVPQSISGLISNASGLKLNNTGDTYGYIDFHFASSSSYTSNIYEVASGKLRINHVLYVQKDGNVGISNDNPTTKLDVSGQIKCTSINIGGYVISADTQNGGLRVNSAGLYADTYISALGLNSGGGGGGATALTDLVDVAISSPTNGQVLKYNSSTGKWYNGNDEGVSSVSWSNVTNKPTTIAGYGITDAKIQNGTITLGSNSITPLTSASISDMATKTWVNDQHFVDYVGDVAVNFNFADGYDLGGGVYQLHTYNTQNNKPSTYGILVDFESTNGHLQIAASDSKNNIYMRSWWWTGNPSWSSYPEWKELAFTSDLNLYLPLSGGTMTGYLNIATGIGISDASGNGMLVYHPTSWNGISSSQWGVGAIDCQGVIRSNASDILHYRGGTSYNIFDGYNSGIVDGHKVKLDGTSIEVPVAYSIPSPGTFLDGYWHKLGEYVTAGDATSFVLTIYDGKGYNSQAEQNSIARIMIKDGWQSSRSATNSVGVTIERFGNYFALECRIVATAHNAGAVWIFFPWQYASGTYEVSGQYTSWTNNSSTTSDTTTAPTTNQTKDSTNDHSYLYFDNAYTNSNVASATKLQTARTLWGNSFDGTQNLTGSITVTGVANQHNYIAIEGSAYIIQMAIGGGNTNRGIYDATPSVNKWLLYFDANNTILNFGNVGIGKSPSYKLDVNGTINCTSIRIGGYTITADTTNQGLRINSAGLYADTYISALGANSGGGGGGGVTLNEPLSSINNASLGTPSGTDMAIVWTGSAWGYKYVPDNGGGGGGSGTVTSIKITVPTGFSISPTSAITTSGTFAITFASGYSLPTTAKQSNWDTAYSNNHIHSNKNVLDGITSTNVSNWNTAYADHHTHDNMSFLNSLTSISGTFWGRSWTNGSTVSGNMENVGTIYMTGHLIMDAGSDGIYLNNDGTGIDWHNSSNQYVSSLLAFTQTRVHVSASGGLRIGDGLLVWDSTNKAIKVQRISGNDVVAGDLYATGGISALGMSAGVTSLDEMTFGYLTVNNELNFKYNYKIKADNGDLYIGDSDNQQYIYLSDICSWSGENNWHIHTNGSARFAKLFLDGSRYLYVNNGTLYYYNGSTSKAIAFTN